MLSFTDLRTMLHGFASEPIEPDYSDPRYIPIRENKVDDDRFRYQFFGRPENYTVWISPKRYHNNVGYMGLQILKTDDHIDHLIFSVCATTASRTYRFRFNFIEGMPAVEMKQGNRANVTGDRVKWQTVRCIDLVVFDLIELMLPPQIAAYRTKPKGYCGSTADKSCFICNASVPYNWEICSDCTNNVGVAVT